METFAEKRPQSLPGRIACAVRENLLPTVVLQVFGIAVVSCYFFWPASGPAFGYFAGLKAEYGIGYSVLSTMIFGGVLPYLYLWATGQLRNGAVAELAFYLSFWAFTGLCVDLFYQLQSALFGDGTDWLTIAKKTVFDQFVYSVVFACPVVTLAYHWKENGFRFRPSLRGLDRAFFTQHFPVILVANMSVWIPSVILIYSMPPDLQVPLFNLVLCFFVLLLAVLNRRQSEAAS